MEPLPTVIYREDWSPFAILPLSADFPGRLYLRALATMQKETDR